MSNMASPLARNQETENPRSSATIGKAVKINGQIFSKEDLYVDGDVEGTIDAREHKLTVGPNGRVHAGIQAREVVVLGTVQGNVDAHDRFDIRKDAKLVGDIQAARIVIEEGAYFKGSIDIVKPTPEKVAAPVATPTPKAQVTPIAAAAGASLPYNER